MIVLVIGGSGSGKSEYAEKIICSMYEYSKRKDIQNSLFYIATMKVYGEEGQAKVERHRNLRRGKGFETIEQETNVENSVAHLHYKSDCILVECMSNLVANEMFTVSDECDDINDSSEQDNNFRVISEDEVVAKVTRGMEKLLSSVQNAVIVTNNIFEDTQDYDEVTAAYISALGRINFHLAKISDEVVEVVAGIPVVIKGGTLCQ
ncbi:MAG: bifunctional adenosylcobinamide kinase/adenosylcobinamide-phosphate guanylyltransferase [Lachnospiraceae bacterium]|nr:bifunctional adenosylcobinamide kinase/adenosylcobinamide-phosphate guanylyltransferase [Lachnospiraceae bacterium]